MLALLKGLGGICRNHDAASMLLVLHGQPQGGRRAGSVSVPLIVEVLGRDNSPVQSFLDSKRPPKRIHILFKRRSLQTSVNIRVAEIITVGNLGWYVRNIRWSTTLSSKVNLHHAIDFRAVRTIRCSQLPADFRGDETLVDHRATSPCTYISSVHINIFVCLSGHAS